MRIRLVLRPDVPLPQPDPHPLERRGCHAVSGRDHPLVGDEGAPAGDPLGEEALLDDGHLPRVAAELGVLAAHDAVRAGVHLAAL